MKNIDFHLSWATCPNESFPNQTQPFEVITIMTPGLGVFAEADEDLVYRVTKTIAEESHRFKEYLPAWPTPITPESMVKLLGFLDEPEKEIHPGAWKYYEEAGLTKLLMK